MKLIQIFHGRFPSEKAASLFTAKSAEAFAVKGLEVTVLVPKRKNTISDDPFMYYGIKNNFKIVYIPIIDLFEDNLSYKLAFWVSMISFTFNIFIYLIRESKGEDIIYSNEIQPLLPVSFFWKNCFYEMHDFPESKFGIFSLALSRMKWVLVHNKWKLEEIWKKFPKLSKNKFIYETNAVDIKDFDLDISTMTARGKLELPLDKKIIMYTGHLYSWKGAHTLAQAVSKLTDDYLTIFVGGTEKDIKIFRETYGTKTHIMIVGFKRHNEIPLWQKAADILVLPNTAKEAISLYYTSPMKLYEYMASKRLILASNIPSIREIVNEKCAIYFNPDDEESLAGKIREGINMDSSMRDSFVNSAFVAVGEHTWEKRAQRIINFINKNE
jgi:glycosyltransferase involved in cell wall biosynthesis